MERIRAAANFNQGFSTGEYLASALMDMVYHTTDPAEMTDPDASRQLHRAVVGLQLARDDAEKRALARPVPADETDLLAGLDRQRRTVEDGPGGEGVSDACEGEERHGIAECSDVVAVNSRGHSDPVRRPPRGGEASAASVPEG